MNRVERLTSTLNGERVDRPPFSFWHHFGLQHMPGEIVAQAQIAFAERYEPDFLNVLNDYPYPTRDILSLDRPNDLLNLKPVNGSDGLWAQQLVALKDIVKAMHGETWVVETIDSPWTILCRLASPEFLLKTAYQRHEIVQYALQTIAQSLVSHINEALNLGVNGFYFNMTEADRSMLTPEQLEALCTPVNNTVLAAMHPAQFNILHLQGNRIFFDGLENYQTQAVSWEHFKTQPGLAKGLLKWSRCLLGGINHDTILEQTPGSLMNYFEKYAQQFFMPKMIVAPGAPLPTETSPFLLDALKNSIDNLIKMGQIIQRISLREAQAKEDVLQERPRDSREHRHQRMNGRATRWTEDTSAEETATNEEAVAAEVLAHQEEENSNTEAGETEVEKTPASEGEFPVAPPTIFDEDEDFDEGGDSYTADGEDDDEEEGEEDEGSVEVEYVFMDDDDDEEDEEPEVDLEPEPDAENPEDSARRERLPRNAPKREFRERERRNTRREYDGHEHSRFEDRRAPKRDFGGHRGPKREFDDRRAPKRDFGEHRGPKREFDDRRAPKRDFGEHRGPRREFDDRRAPKRDFGEHRGPRREFDDRRGPKRDFSEHRGSRREFDDRRGPKRDFSERHSFRRDFRDRDYEVDPREEERRKLEQERNRQFPPEERKRIRINHEEQ